MTTPTATTKNRSAGFEIFRIFACFGIIWFHLGLPGSRIAYSGLPYFMILTAYFLTNNSAKKGTTQTFKRIMIPWFFWSLVYTAFTLAKSSVQHESPKSAFFVWMLATGASLHLWYLPFSFLATFVMQKANIFLSAGTPLVWAIVSSLALTASSFVLKHTPYTIPISQYLFITPSLCIGIYFSKSFKQPLKLLLLNNGLLLLIATLCSMIYCGINQLSIPYLVSISAFCIARYIRIPAGRFLRLVADTTFGIYLVHLLISSTLKFSIVKNNAWALLFLTFTLSFIIIRTIKCTPLKRFV